MTEATHEAVPHTIERAIEKLNSLNLTGLYDVHGDSVSVVLNAQLLDCLECLRGLAVGPSVLWKVATLAQEEAPKGYQVLSIQSKAAYDYASLIRGATLKRESYLSNSSGPLMTREYARAVVDGLPITVWHARPATTEELTAYLSEQS